MKLTDSLGGIAVAIALISIVYAGEASTAHAESAAASVVQRVGSEFAANKITRYSQVEPAVAGLSNGNFVVAWQDNSGTPPDTSGLGAIRARIFGPNGVALSASDLLVNNKYDLSQYQAQAAGLSDGGFVVLWSDNGFNGGDNSGLAVRGRRFANNGNAAGGQFQVNRVTQWDQYIPSIAKIPTGGYITAWFDGSNTNGDSGYQIRGQIFAENGARVGQEFRANTTVNGTQNFPAVAGLTTGDAVVIWEDGSQETPGDPDFGTVIRGQLFTQNAQAKGTEFIVNTTLRGDQGTPHVGFLTKGRYVVAWVDEECCTTFDANIRGQVRSAAGRIGGEFAINRTTANDQVFPKVLGLGGERFVVCWVDTSASGPDYSGDAIRCQVFAMNRSKAVKYGPEFTANGRKINDQGNAITASQGGGLALALLRNGDFVVVWEDWSFKRPDKTAAIRGQVFRVN